MNELLTSGQVAALLGCSASTVREWSRRGVLPAGIAMSQRRFIWRRSEVLAAVERRARMRPIPPDAFARPQLEGVV